jgi:hypothetical protein
MESQSPTSSRTLLVPARVCADLERSIIPLLLTLFGDTNTDVREATQDASRVIMSRSSGHCVKLMLPTLLGGLAEKQWRTKKGSIELLGWVSSVHPSLPLIVA